MALDQDILDHLHPRRLFKALRLFQVLWLHSLVCQLCRYICQEAFLLWHQGCRTRIKGYKLSKRQNMVGYQEK